MTQTQLAALLCAAVIAAAAGRPAGASPADEPVVVTGAGATFPYPIYAKWFDEFRKSRPGVQINYQSIGSGGGIRQVTEHTVDFGASDGPMSDEQLGKVGEKVLHIPTVLGAVVPIVNVAGVGTLNLSGPVLADVYLGRIKKWNDPALVKDNPGAALPDADITVVHRADGSGTSYCFTDYLSKVSPDWLKTVGRGTSVSWPAGIGQKGNEGVAGAVKQTPGSIGYVELIYALQNKLAAASVRNRAGRFVSATLDSVTEAASGAAKAMPKDYRVSITDAPGKGAYPISTFTWLLVYQKGRGEQGRVIKDFLAWMVKDGQKFAPDLGYAPLPAKVRGMVERTIKTIQ